MIQATSTVGRMLGAGVLLLLPAAAQALPDLVIEPGHRAGPVRRNMTEAQLKASLPKGQARRMLVHIEEDFYKCGTVVFPGTENEAFVTWSTMDKDFEGDTQDNRTACQNLPSASKPATVIIEGDLRNRPGRVGAWRARNGIRIGMTLRELEAAAGKPFEFSVCQCDYSGVVFGRPRQELFGNGYNLWFHIPALPQDIEAKYVDRDRLDALKSSHVPASVARRIMLRKIVVYLEEQKASEE